MKKSQSPWVFGVILGLDTNRRSRDCKNGYPQKPSIPANSPFYSAAEPEDEKPSPTSQKPRRDPRPFPPTPVTPIEDGDGAFRISPVRKRSRETPNSDFVTSPEVECQRTGSVPSNDLDEGQVRDSNILKKRLQMLGFPDAGDATGLGWVEILVKLWKANRARGYQNSKLGAQGKIRVNEDIRLQKLAAILNTRAAKYLLGHDISCFNLETAGTTYDKFANIQGYSRTWANFSKMERQGYLRRLRNTHKNLTKWGDSVELFVGEEGRKQRRLLGQCVMWYDAKKSLYGMRYDGQDEPEDLEGMGDDGFHRAVAIFWHEDIMKSKARKDEFQRFVEQKYQHATESND